MCHFVTYWDRGNEVSAESGGIRPKICRVREGQRMTYECATSLSRIYMDICAKVRHASMGKGVDPKGSGLCNCSCRGPASPTLYVRTSHYDLSPRSSVHAPATRHAFTFQSFRRSLGPARRGGATARGATDRVILTEWPPSASPAAF